MSNITDFILMVSVLDAVDPQVKEEETNIELFNRWLKEEWSSSQPQFKETGVMGVFTVSINNAANGLDVIPKFRSLNWYEPEFANLMMRKEGSDTWETFPAVNTVFHTEEKEA